MMLTTLARFYADGGFFMHPILLAGLSGFGVVALQFLTLKKRFNPLPMAIGVVVGLLVLGVLGTVIGMIQGFAAVATAPPDMKTPMLTMAISIALNTTAFSLMFAMLLIPPMSVAAALRSLYTKEESSGPSGEALP